MGFAKACIEEANTILYSFKKKLRTWPLKKKAFEIQCLSIEHEL